MPASTGARAAAVPAALRGWPCTASATAVIAALCAVSWVAADGGVDGWRAVIRTSAKTSLVCFVAAFAASSLRVLWRTPFTAWLLANRRYVGVSFAASHAIHLLGIVRVMQLDPTFERELGTLIGGGLAYVLMFAMAATSFDGAAARLGARRWKALHKTGMYYVWIIFFVSYLPRALVESQWYWIPTLTLLAGMAMRAAAWERQRRR